MQLTQNQIVEIGNIEKEAKKEFYLHSGEVISNIFTFIQTNQYVDNVKNHLTNQKENLQQSLKYSKELYGNEKKAKPDMELYGQDNLTEEEAKQAHKQHVTLIYNDDLDKYNKTLEIIDNLLAIVN